jgi:3-phenylpropionate/trans-cinnamate dioxygenase ferredoxin reductase component
MIAKQTFVIVGASLTGAKAAETLRSEGFEGHIVLIGAERHRPYERPPLSKDYLRGEAEREKVYVHPPGFYEQNRIELRLGERVVGLDAGHRQLAFEHGEWLYFDRLLLATGATPRRLSIPGSQLEGIHYLRSLDDSDALRERLQPGARMVVIGAGWIGCEVAASARQQGLQVTVVDPGSVPLERVLGLEAGAIYRDIQLDHGVELLPDRHVESFEGDGRVQRVRTSQGVVGCDMVVVGVGVEPAAELAARAGLSVDNGVRVDQYLESSVPGVFAAGDVANHAHPLLGSLRVEHWANALHQGPAAARNMLGQDQPFERLPYFYSDQYEVGMEYTGYARDWDRVVFRGDVDAREFIAFWLNQGRVQAGMNVNVWDVTEPIQRLIKQGGVVDVDRLANPDVPLEDLAAVEEDRALS